RAAEVAADEDVRQRLTGVAIGHRPANGARGRAWLSEVDADARTAEDGDRLELRIEAGRADGECDLVREVVRRSRHVGQRVGAISRGRGELIGEKTVRD